MMGGKGENKLVNITKAISWTDVLAPRPKLLGKAKPYQAAHGISLALEVHTKL